MAEDRWNLAKPTPLSSSILCFCAGLIAGAAVLMFLTRLVLGAGWYPWPWIGMLTMASGVFTTSRSRFKVREVWDAPRVAGLIRYGLTALMLLVATIITAEELHRLRDALA